MYNMEKRILNIALENLKKTAGIDTKWLPDENHYIDGHITLTVNNKKFKFYVEVKKEIRNHQLMALQTLAKRFKPLVVVAERIFPKIKEALRQQNIAYLEANGNLFIREKELYLWIDNQKPLKPNKEKVNRAFTKTGLKLIFMLLIEPELINLPYREMAQKTGVAFTNIPYIFNGLAEKGYILQVDKKHRKLKNAI